MPFIFLITGCELIAMDGDCHHKKAVDSPLWKVNRVCFEKMNL